MSAAPDLAIPAIAELAKRAQWVVWRWENGDKPPRRPLDGELASHSKLIDWGTFDQAKKALLNGGAYDGLGYVFVKTDGLAGVDLDDCRNPKTGEIAPWAQRWIRRFNTYAELSPSGTGVKLYGRGSVPRGRHPGKMGVFDERRFFCVTGQHLEGTPTTLNDIGDALAELWQELPADDPADGAGINVDYDPSADVAAIQGKLQEALKRGSRFRDAWEHKRAEFRKKNGAADLSRYDLSLCTLAAVFGWNDTELFLLIRAHRERTGKTKTEWEKWRRIDYVRNTIELARAAAERVTAEEEDGDGYGFGYVNGHYVGPAEKPVIQVRAGELGPVTRASIKALRRAGVGIYDRGGALYRPVIVDADEKRDGIIRNNGAVILCPVVPEWVELRLAEAATWERFDARSENWRRIDPPSKIAKTIVAAPDEGRWPYLAAIVQHPVLLPDGRLLARSGYDAATKLLIDLGGVEWPAVPTAPNQAGATAARERLEHLLRHFPWRSDKDRAVGLSLLLTSAARAALPTAPLHAVDAPEPGTGKSLLVDAAALLATGARASVMEYSGKPEENTKRLDSMLLAGDSLIAIDNIDAPLEGAALCMTLTQERRKVRVLGSSTTPTVACSAFITANGNNLVLRGDIVRRAVVCRLNANMERPELRRIDQDLLAEVATRRGELVRDCQTIMLAYIRAGRPDVGLAPLGSFEAWSRMVRAALVWSGSADPVDTMDESRESDPTRLALQAVLKAWRDSFGDDAVTAATAVRRADHDAALNEALTHVAVRRGQLDSNKLGYWLRAHKDTRAGDLALRAAGLTRTGIQTWRVTEG